MDLDTTGAAFDYLFVHAQSLAELALVRLADQAAPATAVAVDDLASEEAAALASLAQLDPAQVDLSFLDDWTARDPLLGIGTQDAGAAVLAEPQALPLPQHPTGSTPWIEEYLNAGYASLPSLRSRLDQCRMACQAARVQACLEQLGQAAAQLLAPMAAADLVVWLDRYLAGDGPLPQLVAEIRRADLAAGTGDRP